MDIKVYSYIDSSNVTPATNSQEEQVSSEESSFQNALSAAQKAMELDAAIAKAKQSGEIGLSVYSAKAWELGVGRTLPTTTTSESATEAVSASSSSSCNNSSGLECCEELNSFFDEAANTYQVDAKLLKSIAKAESNFRADAVSSAGAVGIMQLMPQTAAGLGVSDSYNAYENIMGGAKYISQMLDKYNGDVSLALAAYNAGGGNVDKYGGTPPFEETQNYVTKVLEYYSS